MSKSDHEFFNKNEEYEVDYKLDKHGLRKTQANRDALIELLPNDNYTHEEVDTIINDNIEKFEKKKK